MSRNGLPEYHLADMPPVFDEAEPCRTQCLSQGLVRRTFGMLEHFRFALPFAGEFRQFHLVRFPVTADAQCQVEIGMEIVRHGIAVVEVIRHDKVADIHHHLLCTVCKVGIPLYVVVVDRILHLAGFFGERLEVRAHQFDIDGMVVLTSDRESVLGICFLEPGPYQFHNLMSVLSLVIAAFPTVLVIHILGVFLCRGPE